MCSQFVQRRGNFHGIQLKAMVCREQFLLDYPENVEAYATYFPNNETFDMTDTAYGIYPDILHSIENAYNFTTKLYLRKDRVWGLPKILPNGTEVINGMIKSIAEDSADMIWASLYLNPERYRHLDYLPQMSQDFETIFLSKDYWEHEVFWTLYLEPFSQEVWILIMVTSILNAILMSCIYKYLKRDLVKKS